MANLVPLSSSSLVKQQKSGIVKSSKFFSQKLKTKTTGIQISGSSVEGSGILNEIEKKIIQVDKLLKNSLLLSKKQDERKRVSGEQKDFSEREKELEKNKPKAIPGIKLPSPPRMGIFDWIKNFVTQTILGFFVVRLIEHLPKLLSLLPKIIKVTDFITDVGGKMVDRLIGFVDWGYKAIDGTRGFIKKMGGEGWAQNFDKFAGAIDNLIEVAIITALVTADSGGFGGGKPGAPGAPGKPGVPYKYDRFGAAVQRNYGHAGRQIYQNARLNGKTHQQSLEAVRRAVRQGRIVGAPQTGSLGGTQAGSRILGRGLTRAPQRLATQALIGALGKGGAKTVLRLAKPLLGRIPIIGGLLEFGLSWVLGDPIGKAAFRGIGTVLIGAVGAAIGGPIGAAIGGLAGAEVGGKLYEMFFENKEPQGTAVKAAGGGRPATRGGKPVSGPAKRTVKKKKAPRTLRATPPALRPGSMVGGEKKIKQIYPESKDKTKMSPFDFLKQSYEVYSRSTGLGALAALAIKPLMGDKPSYADYKNAGTGVNNWMNQSIASGTLAYAGGGEVKMESIVSGEDYSDVIAKSLQDSVAPQTDKIIQDLMKQLMLKKEGDGTPTKPASQEDIPEGTGSLVGNTNAEKVFNYLIGYGFTEQAAAGVIGNLMQESSVNPQSRQLGGGPGRGIMQWGTGPGSGGRWDALVAWAESSSKDPWKLDTQVEWMMKEMRSYGTLNRLKGVTNVKQAVEIFEREMEKAGTPNYPRRYQFAADALASFGRGRAGGRGVPLGTGTGNLNQAKKIAEGMGLQLTSHYRPGDPGYHGKGRAMDFQTVGAPGNRGTPSQLSFANSMIAQYGSSLKQLIYTPLGYGIANGKKVGLDYWGDSTNSIHYDHVHVAFEKGGKVHGFTKAILGEKGPEFVIDADSTAALEQNVPGFLDALNKAKYDTAIQVLMNYASYNQPAQVIKITKQVPVSVPVGGSGGGTAIVSTGGVNNDMFETLAQVG